MLLSNPKTEHSSGRRMPNVKLAGQNQGSTNNIMPTSTSLQDINSHTHKFNWNKDQRSVNLPESLLTSKTTINNRQKPISHSDDRIFEHPEVTIKPSALDDQISRRSLASNKPSMANENNGGSVPNILEHPDIRTPIVMETQQSSPSSSSSSTSSEKGKLFRQQSAEAYTTLARTTSPTRLVKNAARSNSPESFIADIIESPEHEKSDDTRSSTPPPAPKAPIQIIRQYSETSSASDIDRTNKQHSKNKSHSEEDDFW